MKKEVAGDSPPRGWRGCSGRSRGRHGSGIRLRPRKRAAWRPFGVTARGGASPASVSPVTGQGRASLAVPGGTTPARFLAALGTRDLAWEPSYQSKDDIYPYERFEGIKITDWDKWEDPFRLTMDAYWKYQGEKEKKLYAVIEAFAQNNGQLGVTECGERELAAWLARLEVVARLNPMEPARLALEEEFLLALTCSSSWMVRVSPTMRGRRSSNSGCERLLW